VPHVAARRAELDRLRVNGLEAHAGWLARLPRCPLDARGRPDLAAALAAAMTAVGLPPLSHERAQALLAVAATAAARLGARARASGTGEGDAEAEEGTSESDRDSDAGGEGEDAEGEGEAEAGARGWGSLGAASSLLAPLLRCVRCTSPWCSGSSSRSGCPLGHVWRCVWHEGRRTSFSLVGWSKSAAARARAQMSRPPCAGA
jgi:hypothetical protein